MPWLCPDESARRARFQRRLRARHRARRSTWRASGGDPDGFAEIMRGHIEAGYLNYDDEPEAAPEPSIGRQLLADVLTMVKWAAIVAAGIVLWDLVDTWWR